MKKITSITTQKKNKNRYNIFINESYAFSLDEDILVEYMIHKGQELSDELIERLLSNEDVHKAYTLSLNYLSYRMRSEKEIRDYLTKKEIDDEKINEVIPRLVKEGYIDDQEFANALVKTRINTSSKGPILVKKELLEKGVIAPIIDQALTLYSWEIQYEKALKWFEKKMRLDGKKSFKQQVQAAQQTLLQKGFSSDVIKEVMLQTSDSQDEDAEWEAVVHQGEKLLRKYATKLEGYELKHKVKGALYQKGFGFDYIERFIDEFINIQE